jgi:hypothetical protein
MMEKKSTTGMIARDERPRRPMVVMKVKPVKKEEPLASLEVRIRLSAEVRDRSLGFGRGCAASLMVSACK